MSGAFRQSLPSLVTALNRHLKKGEEFGQVYDINGIRTDIRECLSLQSEIDILSTNLDNAKSKVEAKDAEWLGVLDRLAEADNSEYKRYQVFAVDGTDKLPAYQPLLEQSEDVLSYLKAFEKRLSGEVSHLRTLEVQSVASQVQSNARPTVPVQHKPRVNLPKLILPTFSGKVSEWPKFCSLFRSNIDSRTDLSDAEKFSYLVTLLEGEAANLLEGLDIVDNNYSIAMDQLKQRYDRAASSRVASYTARLKLIPRASKDSSQTRVTFDRCESLFRQMEAAGEDISHNHSLAMDFLSKFPTEMVRELDTLHKITLETPLSDIRTNVFAYLSHAEALSETLDNLNALHQADGKSKKVDQRSQDHKETKFHSDEGNFWHESKDKQSAGNSEAQAETSLFAKGNGKQNVQNQSNIWYNYNQQPRVISCVFCVGNHMSDRCPKYPTAAARKLRIRELRRCFACLGPAHIAKSCRNRPLLRPCFHCQGMHPSALCERTFPESSASSGGSQSNGLKPDSRQGVVTPNAQPRGTTTVAYFSKTPIKQAGHTLLMTAWCDLVNPHTAKTIEARVILDSGSSRDYVTERIANQLNLQPTSAENIGVNVFGTSRAVGIKSAVVNFGLKLRDGTTKMIEANTTPLISNASVVPTAWSELERASLEPFVDVLADKLDDRNGSVDVLLGASIFWDIVVGTPFRAEPNLKLIPSKLGVLLAGTLESPSENENSLTTFFCLGERSRANEYPDVSILAPRSKSEASLRDVDEYWNLETIGIKDDPAKHDDDVAYEKFKQTIQYNQTEGRYEVQWPWIDEKKPLLPTNYDGAKRRFGTLAKRLAADPSLRERYQSVIDLQLERRIIEEVPSDEVEIPKHPTHYLPHRPVITEQKATTKVRIVYDASAHAFQGAPALNDCMYRGPVILPDLCAILIRFRTHRVAILADVEKAFLQIGLQESERDVTRFFWFSDRQTTDPNDIKIYRFCRVLFGAIGSPFLLGGTITYHLSEHKEASVFAGQLVRDIYVDNEVSGVKNDTYALQFYNEAKSLFAKAGMNLQEWCSNSVKLMTHIPENDRVKKTDLKVLGISWDSQADDTLRLTHQKWPEMAKCETKRQVMKAIATVYDPLGWYQPAILPAKIFLQSLWRKKLDWDREMIEDDQVRWRDIHTSMIGIFEHRLPRYIGYDEAEEIEIVAFSDASGQAFATAVYLRTRQGRAWSSSLLYAKSRLAPTGKTITLPRLELLGFTISATAAQFVRDALSSHDKLQLKLHMFCDSSIVLSWLRTKKPLSRFVTNRIETIRNLKNAEFHYIRTKENPADKSTRGLCGSELTKDRLWWNGPSWLAQDQSEWPIHDLSSITDEEITAIDAEVRHTALLHSFVAGEPQGDDGKQVGVRRIIALERFSSLKKLLRTTAIVLKCVKKLVWNKLSYEIKARMARNTCIGRISDTSVDADDLALVKQLWIRSIQQSDSRDVIEALVKRKRHKLVKSLGLKLDNDGIIRSYSRYTNSTLPMDVKYPKLLPATGHFTKLVVLDVHYRLFHVGVSHTLSQTRREFWIPRGRAVVKRVLHWCPICRRFDTKPYSRPVMPPYPIERIIRSTPFQFIGLDYFGPVNVKISGETIKKMWACLFSCLSTRAVHLEWVLDCSSIEFLNCLSRYIARRGVPEMVISDNAPQFRIVKTVGDKMWTRILESDELKSFAANKQIRWKFITELAPWQGGFYERMVGVVKNVLKRAIGRRILWWQEFVTLLTETEAIVNSRPLTYVHSDSETKVLRPADFITDLPICDPPVSLESAFPNGLGDAGRRLMSYWKRKHKYLDQVWNDWKNEYLLSLRERSSAEHRDPNSVARGSPDVGDIVLVKDEDLPRSAWKLARVTKVIQSADNEIRSAEVVLPNKCVIKRSVAHLFPLEISWEEPIAPQPTDEAADQEDDYQFLGFSEADVARTEEALKRFPGDVSVDDA